MAGLQPPPSPNAVDLGNSEQVRSAKIIFLRLRKSIFRTPEKTPENPLTLKSTVLPPSPVGAAYLNSLEYAAPTGLYRLA
ncbi:Uncharacterized protein dnm_042390 [Desulfonema magnum]|uniref:Uncharacterized protein n=1 Tax=Desulfonema magnum TaxID=45655 RepID=A0A975GPS3_9BACT|nr:Uncharacterized protein dnm_042390 [Desulfonema magnum]